MAFTQVTITQNFDLADGTEPSGTVTFTPTVPMLNNGVVIPATPVIARLDGGGTITTPLVANTDSGTSPAGVFYQVVELINGIKRVYSVQVPHDQGSTVTLYSLAQLATPPAVSFPTPSLPTLLTRMVAAPVTVTYAASITLNAALACVFRVTATGNLTLTDITGGVDGQQVTLEVLASGADRTVTVTGGGAVLVPSGTWWTGDFRYNATASAWLLT